MTDTQTPSDRGAELLARLAQNAKPKPPPEPAWDPALIPDPSNDLKPERDTRLQAVLDSIGVIEAYNKFIGKMVPDATRRRTEGVMISCPFPEHRDSNPSAWANTEKDTWFCGGCQKGGDKFDLAAIGLGYNLVTYKTDGTFIKLARQMAEHFGYTVVHGANGSSYAVPTEEHANPQIDSQPVETDKSNVVDLFPNAGLPSRDDIIAVEKRVDKQLSELRIPWDEIALENTFLNEWMKATTIDDLPHEFYFWLGLQALGFCGSSNNYLNDHRAVKGNLYICLYGRTGLGKTRSSYPYYKLLADVFPWSESNPNGVKLCTANSAESLIDQFSHTTQDPTTMLKTQHQVRGLIKYEELSSLISKSFGRGSSLRETLIELFDAFGNDVVTSSRSAGTVRAHDPFAQMLSTTQPNAIHAFLRKTDVESGFLNRWVFAAGSPRVAPIAYGGREQDVTSSAVFLRTTAAWAMNGNVFDLQGDALDVWTYFFNRELAHYKDGSTDQDSIQSRIDLMLKKIIVLLCLNEQALQPTGDLVERALLLYPYLKVTYSAFGADIMFDDSTDCQQKIVRWVEKLTHKNGKFPTKNDVYRMLQKSYHAEIVNRAFKILVELDILIEHPPQPGERGRPAVRYEVAATTYSVT